MSNQWHVSRTDCLPLAHTDFGREVYVIGAARICLTDGNRPDAINFDGAPLDDCTPLYNRRGARCGTMYTSYPCRIILYVMD